MRQTNEPEVLCTPNHDDIRGICLSPLDWQLAERYLVVWAKIRAEAHRQTLKISEEQAERQADADRQMREERTGRQGERRQGRAELFLLRLRLRFSGGCRREVMRQMTSLKCFAHRTMMTYEAFV